MYTHMHAHDDLPDGVQVARWESCNTENGGGLELRNTEQTGYCKTIPRPFSTQTDGTVSFGAAEHTQN